MVQLTVKYKVIDFELENTLIIHILGQVSILRNAVDVPYVFLFYG